MSMVVDTSTEVETSTGTETKPLAGTSMALPGTRPMGVRLRLKPWIRYPLMRQHHKKATRTTDASMRTENIHRYPFHAAWLAVLILSLGGTPVFGHGDESTQASNTSGLKAGPLAGSPAAVAAQLSHALSTGDEPAVRALLSPDVLIFESGGVESSLDEYASHHLPADVAFLADLNSENVSQSSGGDAASAWVATTTRLRGQFKGKDVDLDSTETLVMSNASGAWRIVHVHWSSAPHRAVQP